MTTRDALSAFFREKVSRPLAFREIVALLGISKAEARALKRLLREMRRTGEIILTRKGLYGPAEDMSLVTGFFEAHRDGFGFLIPDKPGERDFFIPPRGTLGAMDGDRVVARVENRRRRDARIVKILERLHTRIAGRIDVTKASAYVRPKNRSITFDLSVGPNDRAGARHGDLVIAEIISYPTESRPAAARIIKVIGEPEDPASEVELIIDEFSLPRRFPNNVAEEAKLLRALPPRGFAGERRKDLRRLPTVTIDGERARDFDDAVSVSATEQGYRLWVHIADVGVYVPWGSALDREAKRRGTSVYFPDRVIPMLPRELSEDLCSLRPQVDRPAFTVEMDFDRDGRRVDAHFYPSLINSDERMTYTSVRKILVDRDPQERIRYDPLAGCLEIMGDLCRLLRSRRFGRGSLDFDLPEPEILLDIRGEPEAIIRAERNFAHVVIEEFMIAANEAVAERLEQEGVPSLYRIHEEPDPRKVEELAGVLRFTGTARRQTIRPADFPALLRSVTGRPEEEVIHHLILRSLKQARYSPKNVGHFGLASRSYTHFTSPIRRYPDLVVHRILREVISRKQLSEKRVDNLRTILPDIAFTSSQRERLADRAEQEVVKAMRVWFMRDKVGEEYEGTVVGVMPFGLRVRLRDFYVEGVLHISYMTDDFYQYHDRSHELRGKHTARAFRIGQKIMVRVDRVDREDRQVFFSCVTNR